MNKPKNIDEYIRNFPPETQTMLEQIRKTIKDVAPLAEEVISYGMPAYKMNGILVYFAAYSKHIGFYPTGSGIAAFKDNLSLYKWSKGAIQFSLSKPLPGDLISTIVKYRVEENLIKKELKKAVKTR